jgi:hypothetical protein
MPRAAKPVVPATLFQLKIALLHVRPPVWRRVVVPDDLTFAQLHRVIQVAMGWEDCHLHRFQVGGQRIDPHMADPFGFGDDAPSLAEDKIRLRDVLDEHKKFRYWYDFGDDWLHEITIEKRLPAGPGEDPTPRLVAGRRACPPEDCGGPWGYAELLDALADPKHPQHGEMLEWAGDFDSEVFDAAAAGRAVAAAVRKRRAKV